jgi:hypothetical protein
MLVVHITIHIMHVLGLNVVFAHLTWFVPRLEKRVGTPIICHHRWLAGPIFQSPSPIELTVAN